jgi:hypothetical protein
VFEVHVDVSGPGGQRKLQADDELDEEISLFSHLSLLNGLRLKLSVVLEWGISSLRIALTQWRQLPHIPSLAFG